MVYMQLAAISYATRALFLGQAFLDYTLSQGAVVTDNRPVSQPSFLETRAVQFIWGDVLKGIEEMSHNVTAALLTLNLGMMKTECFVDQQAVVYQYSSFVLWAPYGVSNCSLLSCYDFTLYITDHLGCCSNFTHRCRHDNGEK